MSEMVERVARVLLEDHVRRCSIEQRTRYVPNDENWKLYTDEARATIAAMREPTEGMCRVLDRDPYGCDPTADMVWVAMIDEALK